MLVGKLVLLGRLVLAGRPVLVGKLMPISSPDPAIIRLRLCRALTKVGNVSGSSSPQQSLQRPYKRAISLELQQRTTLDLGNVSDLGARIILEHVSYLLHD